MPMRSWRCNPIPSRPAQRDKAAAVAEGIYKDATGQGHPAHARASALRHGRRFGHRCRCPRQTPAHRNDGEAHHARQQPRRRSAVVTGPDENGAAAITTIEVPVKAPRGQSFKSGAANPNAKPVAPEKAEAPAKPASRAGFVRAIAWVTPAARAKGQRAPINRRARNRARPPDYREFAASLDGAVRFPDGTRASGNSPTAWPTVPVRDSTSIAVRPRGHHLIRADCSAPWLLVGCVS